MQIGNLTKVNQNSRRAVLATLILIAAAAMYNWFVAPHTNRVLATQRYADTIDALAEERESLLKITASKKKKLRELHEQMGELHELFFTDQQAKEFFSDLQAVSVEEDCRPLSILIDVERPGSSPRIEKNSYIRAHTVQMSVMGSYDSIVSLIARLLGRTQFVSMDSLEMEAFDEDFSQIKCTMILTIHMLQSEVVMFND
jgi:hypothetical protein